MNNVLTIHMYDRRRFIFSHKASFSQDNANNLTIALRELFKLLDNSGEAVPPLVFLQSLRTVFPQFSQQQQGHFLQQDAEECFSNLVSTLDQKLKVVGSGASAASSSSFVSQYMTGTFATRLNSEGKYELCARFIFTHSHSFL